MCFKCYMHHPFSAALHIDVTWTGLALASLTVVTLRACLCPQHCHNCCRHRYSVKEAEEALQQPVVKALLQLCRFRNTHEAFMGDVRCPALSLPKLVWAPGAVGIPSDTTTILAHERGMGQPLASC